MEKYLLGNSLATYSTSRPVRRGMFGKGAAMSPRQASTQPKYQHRSSTFTLPASGNAMSSGHPIAYPISRCVAGTVPNPSAVRLGLGLDEQQVDLQGKLLCGWHCRHPQGDAHVGCASHVAPERATSPTAALRKVRALARYVSAHSCRNSLRSTQARYT